MYSFSESFYGDFCEYYHVTNSAGKMGVWLTFIFWNYLFCVCSCKGMKLIYLFINKHCVLIRIILYESTIFFMYCLESGYTFTLCNAVCICSVKTSFMKYSINKYVLAYNGAGVINYILHKHFSMRCKSCNVMPGLTVSSVYDLNKTCLWFIL